MIITKVSYMAKISFMIVILGLLTLGASCGKSAMTGNSNQRTTNTNGAGTLNQNTNSAITPETNLNTSTTNTTPPQNTNAMPTVTLSAVEVAKHDSASDCWLIISGSVYDVTSFIASHPGGADKIIPNCGRDATTTFQTQGGEGQHSSAATNQLAQLKLGLLGATVSR